LLAALQHPSTPGRCFLRREPRAAPLPVECLLSPAPLAPAIYRRSETIAAVIDSCPDASWQL
jgi:hypothetical protein